LFLNQPERATLPIKKHHTKASLLPVAENY